MVMLYDRYVWIFYFHGLQEERSENRTISRVEFVPGKDDDRKLVTCRAENPNVTGLFLETFWTIDVVCEL